MNVNEHTIWQWILGAISAIVAFITTRLFGKVDSLEKRMANTITRAEFERREDRLYDHIDNGNKATHERLDKLLEGRKND